MRAAGVLHLRDLRFALGVRLFDSMAVQMLTVTAGWQIYRLTGDPLMLGFIGLAHGLPYIAAALWAGHLADQKDKASIILVAEGGYVLVGAALALLSRADRPPLLPLYLLLSVGSVCRSFHWPALISYIQSVVPTESYPKAAAWQTSVFQASTIAGPVLGGLLYGLFGVTAAYATAAAFLAAAFLLAGRMGKSPPHPQAAGPSGLEDFLSGLRFTFSQRVILPAMSLDMFGVLFGGVDGILPMFAALLGAGPAGLGLLRAAPAAGALASSLILAHRPPARGKGAVFMGALAAYGACILLFAFSRSFLLSIALLGISGVFDGVSMVIRSSLYHELTPERLRGRVASVNGIFIRASNQLGSFESGLAAKALGLAPSVVFGGAMTLASVAVALWAAPALRRYDGPKD